VPPGGAVAHARRWSRAYASSRLSSSAYSPRITLGANMRSNRPPIPPAPSHAEEIRTKDPPSRAETVGVVTMLEPVSDSVMTRPPPLPAKSVPHKAPAPPRGACRRCALAGAGTGLGHAPPRFGLGDLHPVLAGAAARRHLEPRDRAGTHAAGLHPEVGKRRWQETRMVLAHVRHIAVDRLRRRIHHALDRGNDPRHAGLSITAHRLAHAAPA